MDDSRAEGGQYQLPPEQGPLPRSQRWFEFTLSASRIIVVLPVVVLLFSAAASFVYGTVVFVRSVASIVESPSLGGGKLGFFLLVTDLFLVGATLLIASFGLYELFLSKIDPPGRWIRLPIWLEIRDLNDLKARVISMIILVAAVSFVDMVVQFHGGAGILYLGAGVALVIAALTAFLRFGQAEVQAERGTPGRD